MCGLLGFSFFIFVSSKGPALGYHYHAPILEVSGTSRESGSVINNHASTYRSYSQRNAGNSWSVIVCHSQGKQYEATRQIGKRHESGGLRQKERSLLAFVWAPTTFLYPHCPSYWPPEALDYVFDMSVHLRVRTRVPGWRLAIDFLL